MAKNVLEQLVETFTNTTPEQRKAMADMAEVTIGQFINTLEKATEAEKTKAKPKTAKAEPQESTIEPQEVIAKSQETTPSHSEITIDQILEVINQASPDHRKMIADALTVQQPAPVPGQKWNLREDNNVKEATWNVKRIAEHFSNDKLVTLIGDRLVKGSSGDYPFPVAETPTFPPLNFFIFRPPNATATSSDAMDVQTAHKEAEAYYVVSGTGKVKFGMLNDNGQPFAKIEDDKKVTQAYRDFSQISEKHLPNENGQLLKAHDLIFVPAATQHAFYDCQDLVLLVIFGPRYTSGPVLT